MNVHNFWYYLSGYIDVTAVYISILLGNCALISFAALTLVMVLRNTLLKRAVFLKGMIWGIFIIVPFMGRMKLFYENGVFAKLFQWWNYACMHLPSVRYIYLSGMVICSILIFCKRRRTRRCLREMQKNNIDGQDIYVCSISITPFSSGLIRGKIVIPEIILKKLSHDELKTIILHEKTHIYSAHLWYYFFWDILSGIFWINPLFFFCTKYFKNDLEDICDRITIQKSGIEPYKYGQLLLNSIRILHRKNVNGSVAFVRERKYIDIKRRFEKIVGYKPYKSRCAVFIYVLGIFLIILMFMLTAAVSYPSHTEYSDLYVVNDSDEFVTIIDTYTLNNSVRIYSDRVFVDMNTLNHLFAEEKIETSSFFILFGGYYKLPGIGGGGNAVYIDDMEGDVLELFYYNNDLEPFTFIFKYL